MNEEWRLPAYAHWIFGIGGLFTFGFLWVVWLVVMLVIEFHNRDA